jgi:diguanylate cyclase (GGDEF)-like protein
MRSVSMPAAFLKKRAGSALALLAMLAGIGALGFVLRGVAYPRLALLSPISLFTAAFCDAGTALILLGMWRDSTARHATLVLALSFAVSAVLMGLALLVLPAFPGQPPAVPAGLQAGPWLQISWNIIAAIGAAAYVALRHDDEGSAPSRRFTLSAACFALLLVGCGVAVAFVYSNRLPALITATSRAGIASSGIGAAALVALVLAALLTLRIRDPSKIDAALTLSLAALALNMTLILIAGGRYTIASYSARLSLLLASVFVLVSAVQTLIAAHHRVRTVELTLSRLENESLKRAGRIRALLEISAVAFDQQRFATILQIATTAIRPGRVILGLLSHLDGETIVIDATSWTVKEQAGAIASAVYPGASFPFSRTLQSLLVCEGRSQAWDDLTFVRGRGMLCEDLSVRSVIGTPLSIGRSTYYLTFCSTEPMTNEPFAEDDIAFVDVVASHVASRITQQQQFEQIKFQIEHDALTGLENRVQLRRTVREAISAAKPFGIAFIDLDGFRSLNERHGHQLGDEILVEVAAGLAAVERANLVARMDGDEFAVLLRGVDSVDSVATALRPYTELLSRPFHTGDRHGTRMMRVGASIGAARFPDDGNSVEELNRRAGVALDVAKGRGGSGTAIFDASMQPILEESHLRSVELSDAIVQNQLALLYQPTFDLATRRIVGAEALVRWDHPERGRLLPGTFIPLAERTGLIEPLSRWVLDRVVRDLATTVLPHEFRVYFNLGAQMLDNVRFISDLQDTLELNPDLVRYLGIEITESAAMENIERSMHTIDLFRSSGLQVAIDDFGTGYSSLSYLKRLTVDLIKIDRSFVAALPDDERDAALAEMLLRISQRFGFITLAEGIENEAQAAWLLSHGCRLGQGFLFAPPDSFVTLLNRVFSEPS